MSQSATYSCPHCQHLFSINNPALYGTQISCPTCKNPLVIAAPQPPTSAATQPPAPSPPPSSPRPPQPSPLDSFPTFQDPPTQLNTPTPPRRASSPKKTKKKNKKAWLSPLIVVAAIVGILTPVGLLSFFLSGGNRGQDGNVVDMTWLPEGTEMLAYVNVRDVVHSSIFQQQVANDPQFTASANLLKEQIGFSIEDIESVTIGADAKAYSPVGVLRLSADLDTTKLGSWKSSEVNGRTVYSAGTTKLLLPNPRTIVFGEPAILDRVAEQGPVKRRFPGFDFADSRQDAFVCFVPKDKSVLRKNAGRTVPSLPGAPAELSQAMVTIQNKTAGIAFGGSVSGSDLDLKVQTKMEDSTVSGNLAGNLNAAINEGRSTFQQYSGAMPVDLKLIAQSVMDSLTVGKSGPTVALSVSLPGKEIMELSKSARGRSPLQSPFGGSGNPLQELTNFGKMFQ